MNGAARLCDLESAAARLLPPSRASAILAAQRASLFGTDLDATMTEAECRAVRAVQMHPDSHGATTFRQVVWRLAQP